MHPDNKLSLKYLGLPVRLSKYKQEIDFNHFNRILEVILTGHPQARESFRRLLLLSQRQDILAYRSHKDEQIEENKEKNSAQKEIRDFYYLQGLGLLYAIHSKEGISLNVDKQIEEKIEQAKTLKREYDLYHEVAIYLLRTAADNYENKEVVKTILREMQADEYLSALDTAATFKSDGKRDYFLRYTVPALAQVSKEDIAKFKELLEFTQKTAATFKSDELRNYFLKYAVPALALGVNYNYEMLVRALDTAATFKSDGKRDYFLRYTVPALAQVSKEDIAKFKELLELTQKTAATFKRDGSRNDFLKYTVPAIALEVNYNYEMLVQELNKIKNNNQIDSIGSSPLKEKKEGPLLCLTPDSLITLADGSQKPLIELKPFADLSGRRGVVGDGDMVLSLNEATGRLEPHRVLALLDMGVKPVYRITTASGKSLKTTLTHPYRTPGGWKKLSEIRAGEEVAVIRASLKLSLDSYSGLSFFTDAYFSAGDYGKSSTEDFRLICLKERKDCRSGIFHSCRFDFYQDNPGMRANGEMKDIAKIIIKGKQDAFFPFAELDNFFIGETRETSLNNGINLISSTPEVLYGSNEKTFVSKEAHLNNFLKKDILIFNNPYNIMNSCLNILTSKLGITVGEDSFYGIACFNKLQNHIHRNSCSFNAGLSKTDFGVNRDSICQGIVSHYFHLPTILYHKIKEASSRILHQNAYAQSILESDILWDKIVSIEPLGPMQVYDIEVEATHNFIAQGIVAHNTYTEKPETSNQKLEGKKMAGSPLEDKKGGIDLNPQNLDLEVQQKESSSPIISTPVNIDLQNFQGFTFQILSIQQVKDWEAVLG